MKVQFVPRHFVPGVKFTPVRQRVSEYIASNIGPFSETISGNCVIKGVSAVEHTPYNEVRVRFRTFNRKGVTYSEVYSYLSNKVGYHRVAHKASTVMGFAKANPRGRFVILVRGHLTTVIDGVIMDDYGSERMRVKAVYKWYGPVK
jgi:hypothetical protein